MSTILFVFDMLITYNIFWHNTEIKNKQHNNNSFVGIGQYFTAKPLDVQVNNDKIKKAIIRLKNLSKIDMFLFNKKTLIFLSFIITHNNQIMP